MFYFIIFFSSAILSCFAGLGVKKIASKLKIQDIPDGTRKKHKKPVPLLGGFAPFLAFAAVCAGLYFCGLLPTGLAIKMLWIFIASLIIMIGGALDDKYFFPPKYQIIFPILAVIVAIFGGAKIDFVTNPLGGVFYLGAAASFAASFFWLFTISYTTKILDGLDGLVGGIIFFGAISIFLFSTFTDFKEAGISQASLALAGVFAGFLILNFYPAKIFLGEGGSVWAGFILGALAILTGAKISVTLLVLALPLTDFATVILRRALIKKKSIFKGDRLHLHFMLIDRGWPVKKVIFLYWGAAAAMGISSIFLPSIFKVIVLSAILLIYFWTEIFFFIKEKND